MTAHEKIQERIRRDPDFFFEKILGVKLWGKQREIVLSIRDHRNTSVRSCHGIGKTFTIARVALWFLFAYPPAIVINTAPTDRQVRHQYWKEFRIAHAKARRPLGGKLFKTRYEVTPEWFAFGFSTRETDGGDTADKFQGFHGENILLIVDEASGVKESVFEAIDGAMSGGVQVRKVYVGNPTRNDGSFASSFTDPGFNKIQISAYDIPNVIEKRIVVPGLSTWEWVEEMKRKYGEDSDVFRVRVKGEPPKRTSDSYIGVTEVADAIDRDVEQDDERTRKHDLVLGVDVARFGDDSTDLVERCGKRAKLIDQKQGQATTETAGKVAAWLLENPKGRAHIDTIGVGGGVYDMLKEDGRFADRVYGVNVAHSPTDEGEDLDTPASSRFALLRDEGWDRAREWLKTGSLEKHESWYELAKPRYTFDRQGRVKIESKADMKKRKVPSPNTADALILTLLPGEADEGPGAWTG
jgi:hypothetical protein